MKYPTNLPTRKIADIDSLLAARIKAYFDRGELGFDTKQNSEFIYLKYLEGYGLRHLELPDLYFPYKRTNYYSKELKTSTHYIDEIVDVPLQAFEYYHIYLPYKESLLSNKLYYMVHFPHYIKAAINGKNQPVATHDISLILPEEDCKKLKSQLDLSQKNAKIRMHVKGPAFLVGGRSRILYSDFLDFGTSVLVESYSIKSLVLPKE